ncbi:MAG: hypothetical protein J0H91_21585 [Rhodospirillales bacterium]|nr:hypothetical protein [Rhodospirillales bacterium]
MRRRGALLAALALAGCAAPQGDLIVRVPADAPGSVASPLSRAARAIVAVRPFGEVTDAARPGVVGDRLDGDGRSVGAYVVQPTPGRLVHEAIAAELLAAGHQPGGDGAPVVVEGAVQRFQVKASSTGLYWSVVVDVAAGVTATRGAARLSHSYVAHCQDVAYTQPSAEMMAPLIGRCVADLGRQFRDDDAMARVIGG